MKICYISNEYPPETGYGGIGTYTKNIAEGIASLGHEVHVICRSLSNEKIIQKLGKITVHRTLQGNYPLPQGKLWYLFRRFCYSNFSHSLVRLAWAKQAWHAFNEIQEHFDIIEFPECGAEGYYFKNYKNAKKVVRLHTPWGLVVNLDNLKEKYSDTFLISLLEKLSAKSADGVTSPSNSLSLFIKRKWRIKDIIVFPNPIPVSEYSITSGNDCIYTGRIERRKGIHILLSAYSILCKEMELPLLRIIGRPYGVLKDGMEYGTYIEKMIKDLKLGNKVIWIKGTDHSSIKKYLAMSKIAIFPSLWDNLPYSCIEAMASGCAVVASKCGGFTEIIKHNETGMLFEPQNVLQLSQILRMLFKDNGLAKRLGEKSRLEVIEKFDTPVISKIAESFYLNLLKY